MGTHAYFTLETLYQIVDPPLKGNRSIFDGNFFSLYALSLDQHE